MLKMKKISILATVILHVIIQVANCVKPPNYIEKPKVPDKYPPKYEFNYFVSNRHNQASQGHKEIRNGDNTAGHYFVNLPKGESKTTVNYIADEWGFFPVTRYASHGPHHRTSGHFALGQHAVERLNETNLNTNEVYINQFSEQQQQHVQSHQQQAQATFAAPTIYNQKAPIQVPQIDNKLPSNSNPNTYIQNHHPQDQHQQIIYPTPHGVLYNQIMPQYRNQEKHQAPLIYQQAHQIPMIYQYAQQHATPQINYYYQRQPQDVIYHQPPIIPLQQQQQQQQQSQLQPQQSQETQKLLLVPTNQPEAESNNGNINVVHQVPIPQEIEAQTDEILPQRGDVAVTGNLLQVVPENSNNVATDNQKLAKFEDDLESIENGDLPEAQFQGPIVVGEDQQQSNDGIVIDEHKTIVFQQKMNQGPQVFQNYQPPQKQINLQILSELGGKRDHDNGQFLTEISVQPKIVNGHTNNNNFQYLVEDDQTLLDSTPSPKTEAPSRQFLKNFKKFRTYESTTSSSVTTTSRTTLASISASTERSFVPVKEEEECCKNQDKKVVEITQRPVSTNFLAPVQVGITLTNENLEDCLDGHQDQKTLVNVHKNINVKNILVQEVPKRVPVFGDRIIVSTQHTPTEIVPQPVFIENQPKPQFVHQPVLIEKQPKPQFVHQPVLIEKQPKPQFIHQQVIIEKPVIKEVQVPVDRPVYVQTPPQTRVVHQPVIQTVEKPVYIEKVVKEPYEVVKEVERIVDRPVYIKSPPETKVVHQPIYQTVEKPVYIEKIVKEPYEVVKEVEKIVDRPVYIKSPPETKIVHQPIYKTVEKPVYIEKIVKEPYEVVKEVEKIVDRPVYIKSPPETKIVHQPVYQTVEKPVYIEKVVKEPFEVVREVEKIVDRPVYIDKPYEVEKFVEKIIDRPYPVLQTVEKPVYIEKVVYQNQKPDFHVIAKTIPHHKHKFFDFEGLFGFLSKKKEVKHIYVPSSTRHQLKQLNHHQLIASTSTFIEPVKEAPLYDYSRFATTHLNPIKPVYGVPLAPVNYNYAVAGHFNYDQQNSGSAPATIPSSWLQQTPIHKDSYVGPTPLSDDYWAINTVSTKEGIKFRRNVENGRSLRIEYGGFHPKITPSVEIDQNGTPLKKNEEGSIN